MEIGSDGCVFGVIFFRLYKLKLGSEYDLVSLLLELLMLVVWGGVIAIAAVLFIYCSVLFCSVLSPEAKFFWFLFLFIPGFHIANSPNTLSA